MSSLHEYSFLRWVTNSFVDSKLTPIVIIASLLMGVFSIFLTPSEEEPQIVVPMIDVMVSMPGASSKEVEERVISPMEKLIWEIPGVEYVYSTAMPEKALTVVRFYVGEDVEKSLVKVYDKLYSHFDWIPPGCSKPILKPHSIDDVPILSVTFWSEDHDALSLRKIVEAVDDEVRSIEGISETFIKGGLRREVRVLLDKGRMEAVNIDPKDVIDALWAQNQAVNIGAYQEKNYELNLKLSNFFKDINELKEVVIAVKNSRPVYLKDIAVVKDGAEEPREYCFIGAGMAASEKGIELPSGRLWPAVTLSVSKRKGKNATYLARRVLEKIETLKGHIIPNNVHTVITRDYGETAKEKSNELLEHLGIATISVAVLMAVLLGVRASLVVLVAIPVTLAFTLFIYYIHGYTLNRVTLFALIFCIGILVDDPIVGVENIVRHLRLPSNRGRSFRDIIVDAVVEVGSPLILATFTVIFAILPLAFVRGLMGPYMRPMPVGASVAMFLSMVVSFVITPWTAYHILGRGGGSHSEEKEGWFSRAYRWLMAHLIYNGWWRSAFLLVMAVCFVLSCALIATKVVKVKMLPFDNKSEFQVIVDMPEGTTLEDTFRACAALGEVIYKEPYVTDYEIYVGTSAPFNFNGLVRHYYMREGSNVCDIQVNLIPKNMRKIQSHDIAKAIRPRLQAVAREFGANVKVTEIPPGPPVLQTLVAEIYGPDYEGQIGLARKVKEIFEKTDGIVDVDWYMTEPQKEFKIVVDRQKAILSHVDPMRVKDALYAAVSGKVTGLFHDEEAKEDVPIVVRLLRDERSSLEDILSLRVRARDGRMIPLNEIAQVREGVIDHPIYHKNLQPVVYVTADVAGAEESPVYAILKANEALQNLKAPSGSRLELYYTHQPFSTKEWAMKWDGEWHITYEVFRDMGAAFAVVVVIIFILVVGWFRSYTVPLVILSPIPLSLIGIIPAHALMGAFFTATSMIGFIAGAGIVVRNSIILVDFIELRLKEGMPLGEAVIDAGTIRFRPMLLTSSAVVVGSFVILFDPIFQGLAISLMAGEVAATLFSRMVVPILYYLDHRMKERFFKGKR